jgi:hypothetical protein
MALNLLLYRTKVQQFLASYEKLLPDSQLGAIPRSAQSMHIDDIEGN